MSIHEEKNLPVWCAVLILAIAFLLIYPLWDIGLRDLFWDEGEYAAIVTELHSFPPDGRAHGVLTFSFMPLYPLLVKGLTMLGLGMEFSLRLISVVSLAGLTVMVGIVGTRMAGVQAGAAAAAVMFTTVLTGEKAVEGYPQLLTVLLIFSGWLCWFFLGQFGGAWKLGWLTNGLFAGLAFYSGGWTALLYFLLPMMFLKRPFTPWRRLNNPGFPAGMLIILAFILLWLIPRWVPGQSTGTFFGGGMSLPDYFVKCFYDLTDLAFRFLPWTFFLYAPFCAALIAIDKNPLFSKYLRTLFVVSAVILLLNPFSKARDYLYLLPTFALLTGLNYEIVVRRHGNVLCKILRWTAIAAFLACTGALLFDMLPGETLRRLTFLNEEYLKTRSNAPDTVNLCKAAGGMVLAAAAYILAFRKKNVWLIIVLAFTSGMMFFWAVINPYRASQRSRSELGMTLRQALGKSYRPDMTVYKDSSISGLYPECYYLGTRIQTIPLSGTKSLEEQEVHLLSASSIQPPDTTRTWQKTLDVIYKGQNLYMRKGILNDRKDGPENDIRNMRF